MVFLNLGLKVRLGPAADGGFKGGLGVVDPQSYHFDAIAVLVDVAAYLGATFEGRGQHQAYFVLHQHVRLAVFDARFEACIRQRLEAKGRLVIVGRLLGIAYIKLHIVGAIDGQKVLGAFKKFGQRSC